MRPTKGHVGRASRVDDAKGRYLVFVKSSFPDDLDMDGMRIVVDCANGSAYHVAPTIMSELGAIVTTLGVTPDGTNINLRCGSLHPQQMMRLVPKHGAALGMALDGDADRLFISDENGEEVDGDQIMAICGTYMLKQGTLAKNTLVATVMSNLGLERAIERAGGKVVRTQVGDRYVVEEMRKSGYNFGGEKSGHLVYLDYSTTGDGTLAAIRLIEVMLRTGKPLSELKKVMEIYPQKLINVKVAKKEPINDIPEVKKALKAMEDEFGHDGRAVVRFSGTEALARVMVEGPKEDRVTYWAEELAAVIAKALG